MQHLVLRFDAPLLSFGSTVAGAHGPVDPWPYSSMIAGLIGNALGWLATDAPSLQRLQDQLVLAARADRAGTRIEDYQTVRMDADDTAWTTSGRPERRAGNPASYDNPHIRRREYWADRVVTVAFRFRDAARLPTFARIAGALQHPARPLWIGRKSNLPAAPLLLGEAAGASALEALTRVGPVDRAPFPHPDEPAACAACARADDPPHPFLQPDAARRITLPDQRAWQHGLHTGATTYLEGAIALPAATA